jgi:hypothetical protein
MPDKAPVINTTGLLIFSGSSCFRAAARGGFLNSPYKLHARKQSVGLAPIGRLGVGVVGPGPSPLTMVTPRLGIKMGGFPNTSDTFVRMAGAAVRRTASSVNHPLQLTTCAGPARAPCQAKCNAVEVCGARQADMVRGDCRERWEAEGKAASVREGVVRIEKGKRRELIGKRRLGSTLAA